MQLMGHTFSSLAKALAEGETSSVALVEASLDAITADSRAFTAVDAAGARAAAAFSDAARARGQAVSPYAGIPISVKDLFDVAGQVTSAGSAVLASAPPAETDADVVARLRAAGLVIIGRTQMSEFAFTGLGLNPHAPQPPNPRDPMRAPGGSSGGAAVSVAMGHVLGAIGTDTGGSVRVPAAFCGLVGFKPTQSRISRAGVFPLSTSLDSIGPITRNVEDCLILDSLMADAPGARAWDVEITSLRLGVPNNYFLDALAPEVAGAWADSLRRLAKVGARIEHFDFPELDRIPRINAAGTIANAEAFALHRRLGLLDQRDRYDPNVLARIDVGGGISAADYIDLLEARVALMAEADQRTAPYDAILAPTVPILPPRIDAVRDPGDFARANGLALRNASVVNLLDRCAISLPMLCDAAPCGLMMIGETLGDARLLSAAAAVEAVLA
jgi:aspartyl-tRNA(Asn)/glutamyl-tRNA(Gln) amidotransferase subunit A